MNNQLNTSQRAPARIKAVRPPKAQTVEVDPLMHYYGQTQFLDHYCQLGMSRSALRWMVRNRDKNGLTACGAIKKIHGHLLVHIPRFTAWLDSK